MPDKRFWVSDLSAWRGLGLLPTVCSCRPSGPCIVVPSADSLMTSVWTSSFCRQRRFHMNNRLYSNSNNTETFSTFKWQILWRNFKKLSKNCLMFHAHSWQFANMLLYIRPPGNWCFGALVLRASCTSHRHRQLTWTASGFEVSIFKCEVTLSAWIVLGEITLHSGTWVLCITVEPAKAHTKG